MMERVRGADSATVAVILRVGERGSAKQARVNRLNVFHSG